MAIPAWCEGSGEVMGASLVAELLQLIEYARGARLLKEVDGKQVCEAVLRGQFAESMIKELYRQSLIEGFSGENTDNEKLFTSLEPLSVCIGLDAYEVAEIHEETVPKFRTTDALLILVALLFGLH